MWVNAKDTHGSRRRPSSKGFSAWQRLCRNKLISSVNVLECIVHLLNLGGLGSLGATWAMFAGGALISFIFQARAGRVHISPGDFIRHLRLKDFFNHSTRVDVTMLLIAKPIDKLLGPAFAFSSIYLSGRVANIFNSIYPGHEIFESSVLNIAIFSFLLFLILDFLSYVTHLLSHFVPVLWELHKVHHSATTMTPLTIKRTHPVGDLFESGISALFMTVPLGMLRAMTHLGFVETTILLSNATLIGSIVILEPLKHCPFRISYGPLDRVLCSPIMHQVHHGCKSEHWDKNFGNKLMIWDTIFGTAYHAKPGEEMPWGLGSPEEKDYNTVRGAYFLPLLKMKRLVWEPRDSDGAARYVPGFWERVMWRSSEEVTCPVSSDHV